MDYWGKVLEWKLPVQIGFFLFAGAFLSFASSLLLNLGNFSGNGEAAKELALSQGAWASIKLLLLSPILEELLFRYVLFRDLLRNWMQCPFWISAVFSSLIFGILHKPFVAACLATVFGIVFCIVYERTGKLWYSICMHLGFNLFSFCALLFSMS